MEQNVIAIIKLTKYFVEIIMAKFATKLLSLKFKSEILWKN
jgi:hypothetical protein